MTDATGRRIGAVVTMHDITDRKQAEATLEKQRRIHQAIIDKALRRLAPDIPIILASGYDEAHVMEGIGPQLPQAFLRKPYSLAALKAALSKAMNERS